MKRSVKILWRVFVIGLSLVIILLVCANYGVFGKMPSIEDLENPSASQASQVFAEDGTLMGKYYADEDRVNVEYKDISPNVINALISTEDERFYDHSGVDAKSLGRAFARAGRDGGGSTITMQTAKNLFTENWSTKNFLLRSMQKIKECIIAVKLEKNFTKEEIITLYLNTAAYSDNVFGIRNASLTFFQKNPDVLNVEEAAVLVGMLKGATLYNPMRNPKTALDRRNTVLDQMVRNSKLDSKKADILKKQPIVLNYKKLDENNGLGPYFRSVLAEDMKKWCKEHRKPNGDNYNIYKDGLKIYTTINPRMQMYAEEAVSRHISSMQRVLNRQDNIRNGRVWKGEAQQKVLENAMRNSDRWRNLRDKEGLSEAEIKKTFDQKTQMRIFSWNGNHQSDTVMTPMDSIKYHRQMLQAGFMAMDPLTGEIKAWVGGIDFKTYKFDHVNINTKRQVGSTMKPLLYSFAIEDAGFNPNTTVVDQQQNFGAYGEVPATGASCTGRSMPMVSALTWSRNCASAYIMKQLDNGGNMGARKFTDFLKRCELQTKIEAFPSIALGSCEISLYEMMQAYTMFPGRGFNVKPMFITRIEDKNGNVLEQKLPERKEVISEYTAYTMAKMMENVVDNGTAQRLRWSYEAEGNIAGKTGTTNDNSDGWFMGYTPQLLAGAWVGCDDRFIRFESTDEGQGASVALPIWAYFYNKALADKNTGLDKKSDFVRPDDMTNDLVFENDPGDIQSGEGDTSAVTGNGTEGDYDLGMPPADSVNNKPAQDPKPQQAPANINEGPKAVMPKKPGKK